MVAEHRTTAEPWPTPGEEIANSVSHGAALVAALVACPSLIRRAVEHDRSLGTVSACVFAATVVALYLASTVYHAWPPGRTKGLLRTLEHCVIFLLIAGTYTPFTLLPLRGVWGWTLFGLIWTLAAMGILLKSVGTTRHRWLPATLYLCMAWSVVIAFWPLTREVPYAALMWLLSGGIAYTVGVAFFAASRYFPYCHFVWHLFVMAGTFCHFVAVWHVV